MAQGDFGVVPNVWRPQFVPPINTGEDTQAGIPGNSAANLGATETTVTESFFNVPFVGWQDVTTTSTVGSVSSLTYVSIAQVSLDPGTSPHVITIRYQSNGGLAGLVFRFNALAPYTGIFGTAASGSTGNGQVGYYTIHLSVLVNTIYTVGVAAPQPGDLVTATLSSEGGLVNDLTAGSVSGFAINPFILGAVNQGPGTDATFATGLLQSNSISSRRIILSVEAKVTAGSALITDIDYHKLGDRLIAGNRG